MPDRIVTRSNYSNSLAKLGLFKKSESEKEVLTAKEFEHFFDSYYTSVRNFLYYKCSDAELSEDTAQDAFVKLWETRNRIDKTSLKAYVYTIAGNLLINQLKRQTLKYKFLNLQTDRSEKKSPEYLMEMQEFDQKLQATLAKIPDGAREVFLMNRIDDLKYHEISERLGIGIKAVEKRMSKALGIIRAELDKNI